MPDSVKGLGYVAENCSYLFTTVYGLTKGVIGVKTLIGCRVTLYKARLEWNDFHVKAGTRSSLRDKRLFEISEVEITRVNCIRKT